MKIRAPLPRLGQPRLDSWADILEMEAAVATKTAAYQAGTTDHTILCDASGGAFTVTLPKASDNKGLVLVVKKTDSSVNAVTIDGYGTETIEGAATVALSIAWAGRVVQSDGSNWIILAST